MADPDLDPHAPARAAMWLYHDRYAAQGLGSLGFWNSLTPAERRLCMDMADEIRKARPMTAAELHHALAGGEEGERG